MSGSATHFADAASHILERCSDRPCAGLVLGSGLGGVAERIQADAVFPYSSIPHFPESTVIGHEGRLIVGTLNEIPVVAMQGRFHFYEGYDPGEVTLPIEVMQAMGVRLLILSNASGGLNPRFESGDIMVIEDHIDLMWFGLPSAAASGGNLRQRTNNPIYDRQLIDASMTLARQTGLRIHQGVYAGLRGPSYETRAEYRFLRKIGADVVGMSTIPEALVAHMLGLRVLAFSTVTNVANPDAPAATAGDEVVAIAQQVEPKLSALVAAVLQSCT